MKLIIGAGGRTQEGWISTEQSQLDLLHEEDFINVLKGAVGFENIVMEHVLEHLTDEQADVAIANCYKYTLLDGKLRIAVPDGLHPDKSYIDYVKPGGSGAGADDHQVLYTYRMLGRKLKNAGYDVQYIEWWDETGKLNYNAWSSDDGYIDRCISNDSRNADGKPHYTSLIVDAVKKVDSARPRLRDAYNFVEANDPYKMSPFNRKKTTTFYELARLAPGGGAILELGSYHGIGTAAIMYGSMDGNGCTVYAVDAYKPMRGWVNEPYGPEDLRVWKDNMRRANLKPGICMQDSKQAAQEWNIPVSLVIHDLGSKNRLADDVMDWEKHIIVGGIFAMRDIDDYSMGTEKAVRNLVSTGRWGNRRNWEAFITSMERIE